jgi:hypothetical protein
MLLSISIPAHADPSDWRNPKADANFASEFSEESINLMQKTLSGSEESTRSIESRRVIAYILSKNPEYIYNLAAKICDLRVIDTPRSVMANRLTEGVIASKVKIHPLTARYFGQQMVNTANRRYCPSL